MLSLIIPTLNCERVLVPTLASLVSGAAAGTVRDVIIVDGGSQDATRDVADLAGCEILASAAPLPERLRAATAKARANWVMFLRPGVVLDANWAGVVASFIEQAELRGTADAVAAAFRRAEGPTAGRPLLVEALALLRQALGGRIGPEQGLVISKQLYERSGRHRDVADPEADLLARLGRRVTLLRSAAFSRE
ncbi:MAG: glycosyltransferase [Xanthobacteraceae bacterium]|nr:glycosyltransferase [Xanthobacteraceae bacterium]